MKISGTIPRNPWKLFVIIVGIMLVLSLIAVGEKTPKTPILQIKSNKKNGTKRKIIEKQLVKYL